jgi:hypothetical protein
MSLKHEVRKLLDKQAIYELMCRYCRAVDRHAWDETMECFWPGAIDVHVGGDGKIHRGTAEEFFARQWD